MPRVWSYYNENDPQKAQWIRELIKAGVVEDGEVDERSISDVQPDDLRGFIQCHFFAGIAVWSYALRLANWPTDQEVWTGSCPCPSFSAAGKGQGFNDPRHLWPALARLIRERKPATIFGEQADDAIGYGWLDLVQTDLEKANYAVGKAVLGACCVGAPHIRQRLYFVAHSESGEGRLSVHERRLEQAHTEFERCSETGVGLADATGPRCGARRSGEESDRRDAPRLEPSRLRATDELGDSAQRGLGVRGSASGSSGRLAFTEPSGVAQGDTKREGLEGQSGDECDGNKPGRYGENAAGPVTEAGILNGFWRDAEWLWCRDGKYRPVEPGTFPLVTGAPGRVLRLRGYGDAICAEVAKEFIEASKDVMNAPRM